MNRVLLLLFAILFSAISQAQVTGTKTIGVDYPTLAAAITDLNTNGVGAGGATINVPAGYTETAPSGGYLLGSATLNGSLSAANPLSIKKSGAGANPLLTAFTGGSSTTTDGIFKLAGVDYVTIDGINLTENAANTGAALMEWGYALVNRNAAAPFDGCQNNTIQNATITLQRLNPNASMGIYSGHNTATSATALTLTATGDLHSNNKYYSNNISNCGFAFFLAGFAAPSPYTLYDQNNDVGGSSAATGNTISNTSNMTGFNAFGVYMANHNGANASYNNIGYITGAGSTAVAYGVYFFGPTASNTANNNTIAVGQTTGSGNVAGVYGQATGNLTATGNTITFNDAGGSGSHYGIFSLSVTTTTITGNTFKASNTGGSTGICGFVYNGGVATGTVTISNNIFDNISVNTTNSTYLIYNSTATNNYSITNNNTVGNFVRSAASGTMYGFYNFGSPTGGTATVSGNNFSNISLAGATAFYGIYQASATTQVENVTNNTISNVTAGSGLATGIHHNYGAAGSTCSGNTVSNISGTGAVTGISLGNTTASLGLTASGNTVSNLSSSGASVVMGMSHVAGANSSITKNKIYNLSSSNAGGTVYGISVSGGVGVTLTNNLVGNLSAPVASAAADAIRGISITSSTSSSAVNVYNNTVYVAATSTGANFSSSALFHTTSATATTAALTLRNNILINSSAPTGTGVASAYRRSSTTLGNYNTASNNNMFYAGGGTTNYLYYDGTNAPQTIPALQGLVTPREATSVTELVTPFLSTAGANANFLHLNTAVPTVCESGGANIAAVTDDYDGDVRNATTPDIGADEFAGVQPTACSGTPAAGTITGTANICQGTGTTLTLSGFAANTGISIQWKSSATAGGPYANITGATGSTYYTGIIPTGTTVYYVATVTCANGGGNATATEFSVTSNANPTITVNPPAPSICVGGAGVGLTASGASAYVWSPATGLSGTTTATVIANPSVTTTYTVQGTSAVGCVSTTTVTVTVNPAPSAVTVTPSSALLCSATDPAVLLTASGGTVGALISENFNSGAPGWTTINNSTGGTPANAAWTVRTSPYATGGSWLESLSSNDASQFYLTNSDAQGSGSTTSSILQSPSFSTVGFTGLTLQFYHYFKFNVAADAAVVEVSTNGSTWTAVQTYSGASVGTAAAFANANINLNAYVGNPTVYIRFRFSAAWGYGWAIDNVVVTPTPAQAPVTWTPAAGLYTDAGATTAYVAGTPTMTVYAKPAATQTYTATATLGTCTSSGTSTITVDPPVVNGTVVQPTTCVSTNGSITLALSGGGGAPYTFSWTGPGVNASSQNQTNLSVGFYTVIVTGSNGCQTTTSFTLNGPGGCTICPTIGSVATNPSPTICLGTATAINASGLANMGVTYGITFKYSTSALADPYTGGTVIATVPNGSLTGGGTGATTNTTFAAAGSYFIYAILSPLPLDVTCRPSAVTNLTVNPIPTVNAVSNQTLCAGAATTAVNFSGAVPGTVYNWTNNTPSIGLAASGSGNIASFTAQNAGATPVTATITVTPSYTNAGATCTGTPTTFTITVNPTTSVNAIPNQVVCAGSSTTAVTFSGGQPGTVYNWTNNTPSIGLAASGSGNIAAFTAVNTGTTQVIATITVTPVLGPCSGTPRTFTITVNPNPVLTIVADPGTTLCAGDPALLTVITGTGLVTFTSTPGTINIPGTGTGSSAAPAPASIYPINLNVSGLPTSGVTMKSVTISGISHTWMSDVNILLQSPTGQNVVIMADCGRGGDLSNHTLTFDDAAPLNLNNTLGGTDPPASGTTWKPTNLVDYLFPASDPDNWPAPGPGVVGTQLPLSTFTGDFNGTWKMFITDDGGGDIGTLTNGFNIVFNAPAGVPVGYTFLWTPAAGLSSTTTNPVAASPATTTTYTVTGTTSAGCTRQASILITVNQRPAVSTQPVATTVCAGATATFTAAGTGTGATLQWQVSTDGGTTWTNLTNAAPYSGVTTGTLTINPTTIAMNGYRYRLAVSGTCPPTAYSNGAILTVNPLPVVTISPAGPICGGVAGTNGVLLTASSPTGGNFTWSPATGLYMNANATILYVAGTPTTTVYAAPAVNTTYTVSATNPTTGCVGTGTVVVNYTPNAPTVTPPSATICLGGVQALTITSSLAPVTVSASSGPISVLVPDATGDPALSSLTIGGIPGTAVISNISVTFTMTHTWVGDMDINLVAPNGNRLNLVGGLDGGTGSNGTDNFTGTVISSTSATAISGAPAPRTGTFAAEKRAGYGPTGYEQNVPDWNGLTSTPNGIWRLAMGDFGLGDDGTLTSWSISITYGVPAGGIWTPATGLYTNAGATTPYVAGTPAVTVYASPTTTTTYSVTVNSGTCTSPARTVLVTVNNPVAITSVSPDQTICTDKVATFTVVATGTAPTYQWQVSTNNGNTWTNIANGGVYAGATSATLTITAPPVSMNNYQYRVIVTGAAPCGSVTSAVRILKVNPLPVIVISAAPYTKLYPGLVTTLSSTVSPNAAATYTWKRNGVNVPGANAATLSVDVDGLGLYTLLVTDVNGCTNTSNSVLISDSVTGKLFIYPNPNNGRFQVRYYSTNANTLVRGLTIYDAKGSRVLVQQNSITAPYARMDVDMTKFGKGIYWVELADLNGNRLAVGRVVIQ